LLFWLKTSNYELLSGSSVLRISKRFVDLNNFLLFLLFWTEVGDEGKLRVDEAGSLKSDVYFF